MQICHTTFKGEEATELPSVNFVRETRTVSMNLNEMMVALGLGQAETWHHLFTYTIHGRYFPPADYIPESCHCFDGDWKARPDNCFVVHGVGVGDFRQSSKVYNRYGESIIFTMRP